MREIRKVESFFYLKKTNSFCTRFARLKFKDNIEFKLQVNNLRLHKVRLSKSQVNIKLKRQVTGRRLHETSFTGLRLSL